MGKETVLFKNEEKLSVAEAAGMLRTLADKLEKGKIKLRRADKEVVLDIPERVEFEIKAEKEESKKRIKKKIEVEIEWVVGGKNAAGPMIIS
jgi:amphi-Trp domain-containing protein